MGDLKSNIQLLEVAMHKIEQDEALTKKLQPHSRLEGKNPILGLVAMNIGNLTNQKIAISASKKDAAVVLLEINDYLANLYKHNQEILKIAKENTDSSKNDAINLELKKFLNLTNEALIKKEECINRIKKHKEEIENVQRNVNLYRNAELETEITKAFNKVILTYKDLQLKKGLFSWASHKTPAKMINIEEDTFGLLLKYQDKTSTEAKMQAVDEVLKTLQKFDECKKSVLYNLIQQEFNKAGHSLIQQFSDKQITPTHHLHE